MKKIISLALAAALLFSGVVNSAELAHAEESNDAALMPTNLQVSPTNLTITLAGGDVLSGKSNKCPDAIEAGCAIEVKNIGSEKFRYRVYAAPYSVSGSNYDLSFDKETSYTQISRWMTFLNQDGEYAKEITQEINPGETQTVYYRINVPEDVPGGAQYAVIFVQTIGGGAGSGASVQTVSQAGVRIIGRSIGNTRLTGEVNNYKFDRFTFGGNLTAEASVKNTGNTDFEAHYYYTARTLFGKEIYADDGAIITYPDTEYPVSVNWDKQLPMVGIFTVNFKVVAADAERDETHIVVIMPVFIMILLILLLTIIIVWIIIIIRKRKERKARALV